MLAKERQNLICELLQKNGAVTTAGLMEHFHVSIETIRRDLLVLERNGQLFRVHGGAVSGNNMQPYPELPQRNLSYSAQKRALSLTAATFISEGDLIAIDSGSTSNVFAQVLKESFRELTVVTFSRDVFELLCDRFTVILCSGHYMKDEHTFYGPLTLDSLSKLHVQKAFLCPSAISLEYGICDYQEPLYLLQKQLLHCGEETFVLADSRKFEKKALYHIEAMRSEYRYITDDELPEELKKLYAENGIHIYTGGHQS